MCWYPEVNFKWGNGLRNRKCKQLMDYAGIVSPGVLMGY
jgi:hypothetical protein